MQIKSCAKINLVLSVLGKRPDGYHELAMVMQSIDLADLIILDKINSGIELVMDKAVTGRPEENIAYKAAKLFLDKFQIKSGVKISLQKNIPVAAGLAGGSTDCAGVLTGLNELFGVNASIKELEELANLLGSDTAYCLHGGTMLAEGRGEKLTALPALLKMYGILLKPPFPLSTAAVYKSIPKTIKNDRSIKIDSYISGKITQDNLGQNLGNDLYAYACQIEPKEKEYLDLVLQTKPLACQMSGSGPSIFAFYADQKLRDSAIAQLYGHEVYPIETCSKAQYNA